MAIPVLKGDNPQFFEYIKYMWESNLLTVNEFRRFSGLEPFDNEEGKMTRSGWWNLTEKYRFDESREEMTV